MAWGLEVYVVVGAEGVRCTGLQDTVPGQEQATQYIALDNYNKILTTQALGCPTWLPTPTRQALLLSGRTSKSKHNDRNDDISHLTLQPSGHPVCCL